MDYSKYSIDELLDILEASAMGLMSINSPIRISVLKDRIVLIRYEIKKRINE